MSAYGVTKAGTTLVSWTKYESRNPHEVFNNVRTVQFSTKVFQKCLVGASLCGLFCGLSNSEYSQLLYCTYVI